jgi:hypothetical protein
MSVFGCLILACNISDMGKNLYYIVKIVAFKTKAKFDKQNAYFLDHIIIKQTSRANLATEILIIFDGS